VTDAEFWTELEKALRLVFLHVYEHRRIPADGTPCVVITPEDQGIEHTLSGSYDDGLLTLGFRVLCVSTEGWAAAMAMQPAVRKAVEEIAGVTFIGLDRGDYLVAPEGELPLFSVSLRYSADITAS
jgi:hypothetical protein